MSYFTVDILTGIETRKTSQKKCWAWDLTRRILSRAILGKKSTLSYTVPSATNLHGWRHAKIEWICA